MDRSPQAEEDLVSCRICLEKFKEPKALPCVHRLCDSCLRNHISVSPARDTENLLGFSCPDCREFIPVLDIGSTPFSGAGRFNAGDLIKRLVELYTSTQELHNNNAAQIRHPCPEHSDTEVDLYCVGCSETICHLCASTSHHNCDRLATVNKAAQDHRSLLQEKINEIKKIIEQSLEREKVRQTCMNEVHEKVKLAEKDILESARKWHECVNAQKDLLIKELNTHYGLLQQNVSAKAFKFTGLVKKLQDLVTMASLKMMSSSDLEICLDTSYIDALNSCNEKCLALSELYDSLCKNISDVTCRFEASSSACVTLGNMLFLSNINDMRGSDDRIPSASQMSRFNGRPTLPPSGSHTLMSSPRPTSPPSGSHTLMSSPRPMSPPSGSHTLMSSPRPTSPPSGSHTLMSIPKPMSPPSGSHTLMSSPRPISPPSGSHTLMSSPTPTSPPSGSHTLTSPPTTMSPPPGSQTKMSSPRPISPPSGSHTLMSSPTPMSPPSGSHTLMSSPRPISPPCGSHTVTSSPRPMSPQSGSHTLTSSPRPMSPPSGSHTFMYSPRPMSPPSVSQTLMSSPRPMTPPSGSLTIIPLPGPMSPSSGSHTLSSPGPMSPSSGSHTLLSSPEPMSLPSGLHTLMFSPGSMSRTHTNCEKRARTLQPCPPGFSEEAFDSDTYNPVNKKNK